MRLLMTADTVGGVWSYALDLAEALVPFDVSTTLAILGPPPDGCQSTAASVIPGLQLLETGAGLDWLDATPADVAASAGRVASLAYQVAPDLVHLNSPALAGLATFPAPVLGVCHSCLATWWQQVGVGPMPTDFAWRTELLARGYAACETLVAPSAAFAATTASTYGVQPRVVHNAAAGAAPADPASRGRFVLTAGRLWDAAKNVEALDRAAALIDGEVLAAGPLNGPACARRSLRHIRPLGLLGRDDLAGWMRRAPVFASLSRYEPFGLAVLEAAQSGCALVLSDIPTFRELWDGAALFVPVDDDVATAAALRQLLDDGEHATIMATAAAHRARRYTTGAMARRMVHFYRALTRRNVYAATA